MQQRSPRTPPSTPSSAPRSPRPPPSPSRPSAPTPLRWPTPLFRSPRTSVWVPLPSVLPVPVSVSVSSSPPSSTPSPATPLSVASSSLTPFLVSLSSRPSVYVSSSGLLQRTAVPSTALGNSLPNRRCTAIQEVSANFSPQSPANVTSHSFSTSWLP